ncbi:MAG: CotH kinase family protein, partial [Muribaculaceae bacterium]|nr:CotH kinase family protein [Muribaculaceae bacterium]
VEIDNYDTDPHITVGEGGGSNYPIWFTYKTPETLSSEQTAFLTDQMSTLNRLIYAKDKTDSSELEAMLDIDAFARYYLVQEVSDNVEAFHGSCYLYRNRGAGEKWTFGPVWDFGSAFQRNKNGRRIWQDAYHQVWVEELLKFPSVQAKVKEVWLDIVKTGFDGLFEEIVQFESSIGPAMDPDHERWPDYGARDYKAEWSQTMEMLKQNIMEVGSWYDGVPDLMPTVYLRGDFNNWGLSTPFIYSASTGLYCVYCEYLDKPFKIATSDWSTVDYGAPDNEPVVFGETPFNLVRRGSNIIPAEPIRKSELIFNPEKATLEVRDIGAADDIIGDGDNSIPEYYTLDGRRVDLSVGTKGIYIEKRAKSVRKIFIR